LTSLATTHTLKMNTSANPQRSALTKSTASHTSERKRRMAVSSGRKLALPSRKTVKRNTSRHFRRIATSSPRTSKPSSKAANGNDPHQGVQLLKATTCRFDAMNRNLNGLNSQSNGVPSSQKGSGNTKVPVKKKKRTAAKIKAKSEVSLGKVLLELPLQTKSEANCFEPWRLKHARHKAQQKCVALALNPLREHLKLPCRITLTRFAPHELDAFDNLPMSFKYIADAICAIITGEFRPGKADSDKRIFIACDQIKSKEYGIRIEITF